MSIALRQYQLDAIERVRAEIRAGNRKPLLVAPTGSGKTVIAASIVMGAIDAGSRVLVTAHRRELIKQPFAKLVRSGVDPEQIGIVMAGVPTGGSRALFGRAIEDQTDDELWAAYARRRPCAPLMVASVDSYRTRGRSLGTFDLVIIDEAHRALAKSYLDLVAAYPEAVVLGMTASPIRSDDRGLGALFNALVLVATYGELVKLGFLVEPRVFTVPSASLPELSKVRLKGGDYDPDALASAVDQSGLVGDLVEHYIKHGNGEPAFAFAVNVAHSKHIAERFLESGIPAAHVDGNTPAPERDEAVRKLRAGELKVLCNCDVFAEGTDVVQAKTIILARPTKSLRVFLQQAGRGSRPFGEHPFTILDHAGCALEHGLPQDDREWSLEPPKKKRKGAESAPPSKTCLSCFAVLPTATRVCPVCGVEFPAPEAKPLDESAGELVEVRSATLEEKRAAFDVVVDEWRAKNRKRHSPLKPGWVWHRYKEVHGEKPPAGCRIPELDAAQRERRAKYDELTAKGVDPSKAHALMSYQSAPKPSAFDEALARASARAAAVPA